LKEVKICWRLFLSTEFDLELYPFTTPSEGEYIYKLFGDSKN
jgi:hypothetical protein